MVLMNGATRARNAASLVNRDTQGGSKKAGLFPQVGVDTWSSIAYGTHTPGHCVTLACMRTTRTGNVCASRGIGGNVTASYWLKC